MKKISTSIYLTFLSISLISLLLVNQIPVFSQTTIYSENFDGVTPGTLPAGWSLVPGSTDWITTSVQANTPNNSLMTSNGTGNIEYIAVNNSISTLGMTNVTVLWAANATGSFPIPISLEWSIDGVNWVSVAFTDVSANSTWNYVNGGNRISLIGAEGHSNLQFRFSYQSDGFGGGEYYIDDFSLQGSLPQVFYSKGTGDLNILSTWGTNSDGTGPAPANFNVSSNQTFYIQNNLNPTINSNWDVSGIGTKVIVTSGVTFTIPSTASYSGSAPIDINSNGKLLIASEINPLFGTLDPTSTVEYSGNCTNCNSIRQAFYGNLIITDGSSGNRTFTGNTTVTGSLSIATSKILTIGANSLTLTGTINNSATGTISGSNASDLIIEGSGNFGILNFTAGSPSRVRNLTINRALSGIVTLGTNLIVGGGTAGVGVLSLVDGFLALNGRQLNLTNSSVNSTGGYIRGASTSNILINGGGAVGTLYFDQSSTSNYSLNNLTINSGRSASLGTNLIIGGTLTLQSTTGSLTVGSNTLTLNGPAISGVPSNLSTTSSSSLVFGGSATSISIPTSVTSLSNLTISNPNGVSLNSNLTLGGTLTLTSGSFNIGTYTLTLNGPAIAGTISNLVTTSSSSLVFGGSAPGVTLPGSVTSLNNLTINNSSGVSLNGSPTVSGTFYLQSGSLTIGSNTLNLNGPINFASGSLLGSTTSNVTIGPTPGGTITGNLSFSTNLNLNNLIIDRAGQTISLANDLTVNSALTITNGNFAINGRILTLNGILSVAGTITGGLTDKIIVGGASGTISIPAVTLNQLTINRGLGTSLGGNVTLAGASASVNVASLCTLSAGSYQILGNGQCTVEGTLQTSNLNGLTGSNSTTLDVGVTPFFLSRTSTVDYNASSGNQAVSAILDYASIIFSGGGVKSLAGNIASSPSFTGINFTLNNGVTLAAGSNTVSFGSTGGTFNINGIYQTANPNGFAGSTNTAILNSNSPIINLGSTSTVEYNAAGAQSITVASPASYQNLTLSGSGTKTPLGILDVNGNLAISGSAALDASTFNINLAGNWTNDATFTANTGTVVLDGIINQAIGGTVVTAFNNLTLNNASGATVSSATTINGALTLTTGALASNGNVTLNFNTGYIPGSGTGSIIGNINGLKDVSHGYYSFIGSPFSNVPISDMTDDFNNVIYYDEPSHTNPNHYDGWKTASGNLQVGRGYGSRRTGPGTIDLMGTYENHTQERTINVTYTTPASPDDNKDGWNVIANPYPTAINWDNVTIPTGSVNSAIYLYNGTSYTSYNNGVPAGGNIVAPFQGFWVKAGSGCAPSCNIVVPSSARLSQTKALVRESSISNVLKLKLTQGSFEDNTYIRFENAASSSFDLALDAFKLKNEGSIPSFYTRMNKRNFSINALPFEFNNIYIPLKVDAKVTGGHAIKAFEEGSLESFQSVILLDKKLNVEQDLMLNPNYSFDMIKGDTTSRFFIKFVSSSPDVVTSTEKNNEVKTIISGSGELVKAEFVNLHTTEASINVYNTLGQLVFQINNTEVSSGVYSFNPNLANGIYIVRILTKGGEIFSSRVYLENKF